MEKTKKAQTIKAPAAKQGAKAQPAPAESPPMAHAEELDVTGAREAFLKAQQKLAAHAPSEALRAHFDAQIEKSAAMPHIARLL